MSMVHRPDKQKGVALFISLVLLLVANAFPFMEFKIGGRVQTAYMITGIETLKDQGYTSLSLIVAFTSLLAPALMIVSSPKFPSMPVAVARARLRASVRAAPSASPSLVSLMSTDTATAEAAASVSATGRCLSSYGAPTRRATTLRSPVITMVLGSTRLRRRKRSPPWVVSAPKSSASSRHRA